MSWEGWRPFRVASKRREAEGTWTLGLVPEDGAPLPIAQAGQYLTLRADLGEQGEQVRCYSLSHAPVATHYQVTIKRTTRADGEPGRFSNYVASSLREGDRLELRPPAGEFTLERSEGRPLVLIAGGVGITPILSLIEALARSDSPPPVTLYYGVRNRAEHAFFDRLKELERQPWFEQIVCYSRPGPDDERHADRVGHVDLGLLRSSLAPSDEPYHFYVCGPGPMLESMSEGLEALGVPSAHVHVEAFGALAVKPFTARLKRLRADEGELRVRFAESDVEVAWDDSASSILDLALSNGVFFPFACAAGHCGTCMSTLSSGEVDYAIKPQFPLRREGTCLPCIAIPKTSVVLER